MQTKDKRYGLPVLWSWKPWQAALWFFFLLFVVKYAIRLVLEGELYNRPWWTDQVWGELAISIAVFGAAKVISQTNHAEDKAFYTTSWWHRGLFTIGILIFVWRVGVDVWITKERSLITFLIPSELYHPFVFFWAMARLIGVMPIMIKEWKNRWTLLYWFGIAAWMGMLIFHDNAPGVDRTFYIPKALRHWFGK